MSPPDGVVVGDDGVPRCPWAAQPADYAEYHDSEWGRAVHGDVALFERLALESFQSGLSWLTILRKREGFRRAFAGFEIETVAGFGAADQARLLGDVAIVRNRAKIAATVANAQAASRLRAAEGDGALDRLLWSFQPSEPAAPPRRLSELPSRTAESAALAAGLKKRGFVFVGPTTGYALMQATGMVNDHLLGCHRR